MSSVEADISCPNCHDEFVEIVNRPPHEPSQPRGFVRTNLLRPADISQALTVPEELLATIFQFYERLAVSGPPPATRDDLRHLVDYKITQEDIDNRKDCPICMEDFKLDEISKRLPCKHAFHERCILQWLEQRGTCPVCRRNLQGADTSRQEYMIPLNTEGGFNNPNFQIFDNYLTRMPSLSSERNNRSDMQIPEGDANTTATTGLQFGDSSGGNNNDLPSMYDATFVLSNSSSNPLIFHASNNSNNLSSRPTNTAAMGGNTTEQVVIMNTDNPSSLLDSNAVGSMLHATLDALAQRLESADGGNNNNNTSIANAANTIGGIGSGYATTLPFVRFGGFDFNPEEVGRSPAAATFTLSGQNNPNVLGISTSISPTRQSTPRSRLDVMTTSPSQASTSSVNESQHGWLNPNVLIRNIASAISRVLSPLDQQRSSNSGSDGGNQSVTARNDASNSQHRSQESINNQGASSRNVDHDPSPTDDSPNHYSPLQDDID
ncbi:hypothetical protein GJ496_001770 [Pomphorhynchus laevis]|nr:hypothetical protein GJ496_001770 [Pomphorhynchus laevis]